MAEAFPAGDALAEELEARGWTQAEFADVLGRPAQFVSEIIAGKKEITRESAAQIGAALGTSAELWLNLQDAYFLWRQQQDERAQQNLDDVRLRARLKDLAPVTVLRRRGFIAGDTAREQARELCELYKIDDIFVDPAILVVARRAAPDDTVSSTQIAWIACVRKKAESANVASFSRSGLEGLAKRLTRVIKDADDFVDLPQMFSDVGVRLVFVEAFPSSKMDGCALLLDDGSVVIGISGRGKRLDKVLFTLLHEIAHVLLGHLEQQPFIIDDEERQTLGLEQPADDLAESWVIPSALPSLPERVSVGWVRAVADDQGIHPIVLIGRFQKQGRIPWRTTLVKDAPNVTIQLGQW